MINAIISVLNDQVRLLFIGRSGNAGVENHKWNSNKTVKKTNRTRIEVVKNEIEKSSD